MTRFVILLLLLILFTGCTDNPFYYYRYVHNKPAQTTYINYTEVLNTWVKTALPKDAGESIYTIKSVHGGKDGTRYFAVELTYFSNEDTVLEYHFVTVDPHGKVIASKLLNRTIDREEEEEKKDA